MCANEGGHFVCAPCLSEHVIHAGQDELQARQGREGRVLCPYSPSNCGCTPYADADLARALSPSVFEAYVRDRVQLVEVRLAIEKERAVQQEAERIGQMDRRGQLRNQIASALTMRCPRCRTAFADFTGCCALSCASCPAKFCAWCLKDCGNDAHPHVRACSEKPAGAGAYYPDLPQFDAHCRKRRAEIVIKLLREQGSEDDEAILQEEMLADIRTELEVARRTTKARADVGLAARAA